MPNLSFVFLDCATSAESSHLPNQPVKTASIIKLPILVHALMCAAEGAAGLDEPMTLTEAIKTPGMGVLKGLSAGVSLPLRDVCWLMTAISDNTATNLLIERFGVDAINARSRALGLERTTLFRKVFAPNAAHHAQFGLGATTPHEMANLLARIHARALADAPTCDLILNMLAAQQDRTMIPRYLPEGWHYAGKTGADDDLRNDCGIITRPDGRAFVLAAFCQNLPAPDWSVDNPGAVAIAQLARRVLNVNGS
ncbi:MAG TPA: class A beta-lactamase-related serine hydrolase [Thermoflexales bacterium]|nr:class A beta-lactamase-related serine hydrolase [Thermoflexales bacterium]